MPIYKGKNYIERNYKGGGEGILPNRRIYKEKQLVYGLYDITYYNYDGKYDPKEYQFKEISKYSWGKNRYIVPALSNTLFKDKSAAETTEYKTHWDGWWDDNNYENERPKWSDSRYIVSYLDKSDLKLFAKWRQRKYEYSGAITYYIRGEGWDIPPNGHLMGGGPSVKEESDDYGEYDWDSQWAGQCTWWVGSRLKKLEATYPYTLAAESWISLVSSRGLDYEENFDNPHAGWVACWSDNGKGSHVAFVEDDDGTMSSGNWSGPYTVKIHTGGPGSGREFLGYVNPEVTGGSKKVQEEVPRTECEDQDHPEFPDPEDLGYPEDAEWTEQNEYTSDRTIQYTEEGQSSWGEWEEIASRWILDW